MPHQFKDKGVPEQILKCVTGHLKPDLFSHEYPGIYCPVDKLLTYRCPSLCSCSYYRTNEVDQFQYSRPFRKGEKDPGNEFAVSIFLFPLEHKAFKFNNTPVHMSIFNNELICTLLYRPCGLSEQLTSLPIASQGFWNGLKWDPSPWWEAVSILKLFSLSLNSN